MSTFAVTIEQIASVEKHPNADRLDIAKLANKNYQFVVLRDEYKAGDKVIYFPVDSVLPDVIIEKLGLTGKLSGANKNRVKTIRLRGCISQGLVSKPELFLSQDYDLGYDVKDILEVVKYEPPVEYQFGFNNAGIKTPLPSHVGVYDIENAQNYPDVIKLLLNKQVVVTEKLEGTHYALSYDRLNDKYYVCSRRITIIEDDKSLDNVWIKATRELGLVDKIKKICDTYKGFDTVTIRGELIGDKIQGNIYNWPNLDVFLFDIEFDGMPTNYITFSQICEVYDFKSVPVIYTGYFGDYLEDGLNLPELSNGQSVLAPVLREGIVIKPLTELTHTQLGRLFIKQRSPEYLATSDL